MRLKLIVYSLASGEGGSREGKGKLNTRNRASCCRQLVGLRLDLLLPELPNTR